MQGLNVCYISLELSEDVVAKRFDSIMTSVGQSDVFKNISKIAILVQELSKKMGRMIIKRMPESTTCANHIRAYLKEYERTYRTCSRHSMCRLHGHYDVKQQNISRESFCKR